MHDDYLAKRELGILENINENIEKEICGSLDELKYKELSSSLEMFGELFLEKSSYNLKIKEAVDSIYSRVYREEEVFIQIKNLREEICRIPEVAEVIYENIKSEYKYSASTKKIVLHSFEKLVKYGYDVIIKKVKNILKIEITKDELNYNGKIGILIKLGAVEKKVYFEVKDGVLNINLKNEKDVIINNNLDLYFLIP